MRSTAAYCVIGTLYNSNSPIGIFFSLLTLPFAFVIQVHSASHRRWMLLFAFSEEMQTAFPFSFQLQRYVHVSWSWTDRSHKSSLDPTKIHSPITQGCEKKLWRALDFHSAPLQPAGPLPSALHDVQCTGGSGISWFLFYMTGNTHFSMAQWRHNSTELYLLNPRANQGTIHLLQRKAVQLG